MAYNLSKIHISPRCGKVRIYVCIFIYLLFIYLFIYKKQNLNKQFCLKTRSIDGSFINSGQAPHGSEKPQQ